MINIISDCDADHGKNHSHRYDKMRYFNLQYNKQITLAGRNYCMTCDILYM